MAAPIIPILKKLAVAILTDKKARKKFFGLLLGIIIVILTPILGLIGVISQLSQIDTSEMREILTEYETKVNEKAAEIEETMTAQGFTTLKIEEAQTLYAFALYDYGEQEGFVEKLIECYSLEEQTDEDLIQKVNETFGTVYTVEEYTSLVQEIRDRQVLEEKENQEVQSDI